MGSGSCSDGSYCQFIENKLRRVHVRWTFHCIALIICSDWHH